MKKSQESLEKLEANIISLQEILRQNEEEIKERKKSMSAKAEDACSGHL